MAHLGMPAALPALASDQLIGVSSGPALARLRADGSALDGEDGTPRRWRVRQDCGGVAPDPSAPSTLTGFRQWVVDMPGLAGPGREGPPQMGPGAPPGR